MQVNDAWHDKLCTYYNKHGGKYAKVLANQNLGVGTFGLGSQFFVWLSSRNSALLILACVFGMTGLYISMLSVILILSSRKTLQSYNVYFERGSYFLSKFICILWLVHLSRPLLGPILSFSNGYEGVLFKSWSEDWVKLAAKIMDEAYWSGKNTVRSGREQI